MSDAIDLASDRAELFLQHSLAVAAKPPQVLPACGSCYNCGETVTEDLRWCDSDCRDDYELRARAKP